ncbi:Protein DGCR6,Protein DGCR6L [Acanthosepion pharaonis]|uniref:Protein DGCR6,Protein DGCR6L n=1 Tax=Acanthosepion pharaonis TaxID=158019 RepID=A0A812DIW1_ACAPH|nr:Protein DGCR6,Protein DGCR6L [Sepia pharaonis]
MKKVSAGGRGLASAVYRLDCVTPDFINVASKPLQRVVFRDVIHLAVKMEEQYTSDIERKELLQKRHYFFLNELQQMARELPGKYQQRVPYDLLSGLAHALLDGTVFEIVRSLSEVQHLEEKNLFNQRVKQMNDHKAQKHEMLKKHKEMIQACETKPHNLPLVTTQVEREREIMNKRIEDEVKKRDMKTIMELDQKSLRLNTEAYIKYLEKDSKRTLSLSLSLSLSHILKCGVNMSLVPTWDNFLFFEWPI